MSTLMLRSLLIHFGWISFPAILIGTTMIIFGPIMNVPGFIQDSGSYLYIQFLIAALGAPSIMAISFWAAHNLKNLEFLKPASLVKFLMICVVLNIISFLFALISMPLEVAIYGDESGSWMAAIGYAVSTFFYASTSSLLLLFARKQILAKTAGDNIKKPSLAETFS